jgi:nitroreductase
VIQKKIMLTDQIFTELIKAASLAPSADNMQPWEFRKQDDAIEVFCAKPRVLPTDVIGMFGWIAVGAAIQNIVITAASSGLVATVEYNTLEQINELAAVIKFSLGISENHLAEWISRRSTNRSPYEASPLSQELISKFTKAVQGLNGGIHWTTSASDLDRMAVMDANSTYIRLEHKPLHDELFDILRFTKKDIEATRFGLTFESLEVPRFAVFFARQLQYWSVNRAISKLGFGRLVAKQLSNKLRKAGALCLITAERRDPVAYMEAGRAMEQLWLAATAEGLSIQPYGVLPQYLTKVDIEPETFLPKYVTAIKNHHEPFFSIFPEAKNEYPAIVLRLGRAWKQSARSDIRLSSELIIRK